MGDSPTAFPCTVLEWNDMQMMARQLGLQVAADDSFEPDVIVALARGGWCPTRCVCDVLEHDDATSIKVEHYTGTATADEEPTTRYNVSSEAVNGKNVLLIDDIVDTGASIRHAAEAVEQQGAATVRTGVLQALPEREYDPDYAARELDSFVWVVYPWNVVEDVHDLIRQLSDGNAATYEYDELCEALSTSYGLDAQELETLPFSLETILETLAERDQLSYEGSVLSLPERNQ